MRKNASSFLKTFLSYAMITIIPIFILVFVTVGFLFTNLEKETKKLNENIIEQSQEVIDSEIEGILSLFYQVEHTEKIQNFIEKKIHRGSDVIYDLYEITNDMNVIANDNFLLKQFGIYLKEKNYVITTDSVETIEEFYDTNYKIDSFKLEDLKEEFESAKKTCHFLSHRNKNGESVILCYRSLNVNGKMNSGVIFAILDHDMMTSTIKLNDIGSNFDAAIIDSKNNIIMKTNGFEINYKENTKRVGKNLYVFKSNIADWNYVFTFVEGKEAGNVRNVASIFLLLTFLMVILSLIIAFFHTQRIRKMFLRIFTEDRKRNDYNGVFAIEKERALSSLLHNADNEERKDLKETTKFSKRYFCVISFSDLNSDDIEFYSSIKDEGWKEINAVIMKIINEKNIDCEIVRMGSSLYSFILNFENKGETKSFYDIVDRIKEKCGVVLNCGIGTETECQRELHISYECSASALRYGMNKTPGSTVFYDEINTTENKKAFYTEEKENQLIRNLKNGNLNGARDLLKEIYEVNFKQRHISYTSQRWLISSLLLSIYKAMNVIFDSDEEQFVKCSRICNNLHSNDNIEECFSVLFKSLELICVRADDNQDNQALKEKIENYINENFDNPSLSLEMLSKCTGIAYYHLSRVFKELFGTNFIKYLNLYRLEKAKELLKHTQKTMEQIAIETGFLSGDTFAKAFKKYHGMPPSQYRKT